MIFGGSTFSYSTKLADMADAVAMQPVRRPVRRPLRVVRIKNEDGSVANVQRIMQGAAYHKKRSAVRLSESDLERSL